MNRVKELDLVDRGPEEPWTEVCNTTGVSDKNHPKGKEMQEGKVVVLGFTNSQGKKSTEKPGRNRYSQLNAELQRTAGREKAFSDQCKEVEESDRVGRTRDLFKKTGDIKGTFHARMGTIKDRKCTALTEAEEIKERWQEDTRRAFGSEEAKVQLCHPKSGFFRHQPSPPCHLSSTPMRSKSHT